MEYAVTVADRGSINAAAEALRVAQPSVSQAIRSLEAELGVALFDRLPSGARPTEAGKAFLGPARLALRDAANAREAVDAAAALERGRLDVVCLATLAVVPAAGLVGELRRRHPGIVVRMGQPESVAALIDRIRGGDAEIGITEMDQLDDDLSTHPIGTQDFVVLVPKDEARSSPMAVEQLSRSPVVTAPQGTSTRRQLDEALETLGLEPAIAVETENREAIVALVASGAGVALVPRSMALLTPTAEVAVRDITPRLRRSIGIVHRPGPLSPAAAAFLEIALPGAPEARRKPRPRVR